MTVPDGSTDLLYRATDSERTALRVAQGVDLLGLTLEGPEPVGIVHLPAKEGVTTLYGRNGAGKSTILRGVQSALLGVAQPFECLIHFRLSEPRDADWLLGRAGVARALSDWAADAAGRVLQAANTVPDPGLSPLGNVIGIWLTSVVCTDDTRARLASTVAAQGLLTFVPSGTRERPGWDVFVGAWCSASEVCSLVAESDRAWREILRLASLDLSDEGSGTSRRRLLTAARPRYDQVLERLSESGRRGLPHAVFDAPDRVLGFDDAPEWVPRRLRRLGTLFGETDAALVVPELIAEDTVDVDDATRRDLSQYLRSREGSHLLDEATLENQPLLRRLGAAPPIAPDLANHVSALVTYANRQLGDLLDENAPNLRCEFRPLEEWLSSQPVKWEALDAPRNRWVGIDALSQAQRRWSIFAVRSGLAALGGEVGQASARRRSIAVIDEPEAALHPLAEQKLFRSLGTIATWTVAATHAPVFWDDPTNEHLEVYRDEAGLTSVRPIGTEVAPTTGAASSLGLTLPDYVRFYRTLVFVEGEHDRAVLEAFIGPELASTRTWVLPLAGADGLSHLAAATPLFQATDARVIVVLDHVSVKDVMAAWSRAQEYVRAGDMDAAIARLAPLRQGTKEERLFAQLGCAAIKSGQLERLLPFGFREPDIIFYLDPSAFVRRGENLSWRELDEQWRESGTSMDLKSWLRSAKGARISTMFISNVARTMPRELRRTDEFAALVELLRR